MILVAALSSLAGFVLGAHLRTLGLLVLTSAMMVSILFGTLLSGHSLWAGVGFALVGGVVCQASAVLSMILLPRGGRPPDSRPALVPASMAGVRRR